MDEAQLKVLQMVQRGAISAEEAEELLSALDGEAQSGGPPEAASSSAHPPSTGEATTRTGPPRWWQRAWVYVLGGGTVLAALALAFTITIAQGGSHLGWLACTLPLLILGVLVMVLTWWSRSARWLHVRVREEGQRVNISLPLPLRPAVWALRLARPWVPKLRETAIDEVILSLADADIADQEMLVVEVDDAEAAEQVEVRIG
jgi:hypothetical protein